jgi:prepilin-type processing-associated H-X9-DG protein
MNHKPRIARVGFAVCVISLLLQGTCLSGETSIPPWARAVPGEAAFVFAVDDVEEVAVKLLAPANSTDPATRLLLNGGGRVETRPESSTAPEGSVGLFRRLVGALKGEFCCGITASQDLQAFFLVANLKPEVEDPFDFVAHAIQPLLASLGIESVLEGRDQEVHCLRIGDHFLHFTEVKTKFLASTDRDLLLRMREGRLPEESTLANDPSFQKAIRLVPPKSIFKYMDFQPLARLAPHFFSKGTRRALSAMGLDRLDAIAASADISEDWLNLDFAITNNGEFVGLPAVFARPNVSVRAATFVPRDYSAFLSVSVARAGEAHRDWQAVIRKLVDDEGWQEYLDELEASRRKYGFGIADVLDSLGDEVSIGVKFPELPGIPPVMALAAVKDEKAALDRIAAFLSQADAKPEVVNLVGQTPIYVTGVLPGIPLCYAAKGGYVIVGISTSAVTAALQAQESGESLAREKAFASVLRVSPEKTMWLGYIDLGRASQFIGGMLSFAHAGMRLPPRETSGEEFGPEQSVARILRAIQRESAEMGHGFCFATRGPDAISGRSGVPLKAARFFFSILEQEVSGPVLAARERALKAACLSNLKQILLGCHMYANEHAGSFPEKMSEILPYVKELSVFSCPATHKVISCADDVDSLTSYQLIPGLILKDVKNPADTPAVIESVENHGDGANVGFVDSHVQWLSGEALQALQKQNP